MRNVMVWVILVVSGCAHRSTGLSPREGGGAEYTAYLFQLYQEPGAGGGSPAPLTYPIHLAVAQVGEVAPPQSLVASLRCQPGLFARVEAVPGNPPYVHLHGKDAAEQVRNRIDLMRRFARDLGMTHLFLYGGTIDHGTEKTPLGVLDLTVVGAYVVPSRKVSAVARTSGAMIDLSTGRVVFLTTAEAERSTLAAKMTDESTNEKLVERIRDEVIGTLGRNLVADASRRLSAPAVYGSVHGPARGIATDGVWYPTR